jgi:hypothetical protein
MSNVYTLKIDIDDSKIRDIEKRLMNIVGGGGSGKQGGGIGGQMTQASGGSQNKMLKNIGKLAMIATGVLAVVAILRKLSSMMIQSSPMLQQMLKLLNFGILLILRPIGDFFGFFLRPIIMYFLRNIALPWFHLARPIMQKWGTKSGEAFAKDPLGSIAGIGGFGTIGIIVSKRDQIIDSLEGHIMLWSLSIDKFVKSFSLMNPIGDILAEGKKWLFEQFDLLPNFAGLVSAFVRRHINRFVKSLPVLDFSFITTWLDGIKLPTWDDFNSVIKSIQSSAGELMALIWGMITGLIDTIFGKNNNNNQKTNTTPPVQNNFIDLNMNGVDDAKELSGWLSDIFKGGTT